MIRIGGIGAVFSRGRGVAGLEEALRSGWAPPAAPQDPPPGGGESALPAFRIDPALLKEKGLARMMRRADRFSRIAAVAAWDAVRDAEDDPTAGGDLGIILATAFGPHAVTFRFLDDILDYGDLEVSPTTFSHSVHNAAVSYVAQALKVQGPTQTVTHFAFAFHEALALAEAWLDEGRCSRVLVGAAEECGPAMETICGRMHAIDPGGKISPFDFARSPVTVPGEGSVFFLVSKGELSRSYCRIGLRGGTETAVAAGTTAEAAVAAGAESDDRPDLQILECNGMAGDESGYADLLLPGVPVAAYAPLFGGMMTGSAFSCAVAALMIDRGTVFASPVTDNPHDLHLCRGDGEAAPGRIVCLERDCAGRRNVIELRRDAGPRDRECKDGRTDEPR